MLRTLSLLVLALVSASLPAQDEARVLNTFKKAFAAPKGKKPGAPLAECRWKWRRLRCLPASVCTLRRPPDWRSVLRIKAWHPCMPR